MGDAFTKAWKAAAAERKANPKGEFPVFEDGDYSVILSNAERGESKKGRHQLCYEFEIVGGPSDKGSTIRSYDGLETEQNMYWAQLTLSKLGIDPMPQSQEDLDAALLELVATKPQYQIRLITKGKYQNTRVIRKLGGPEVEESEVVVEEE